MIAGPVLSICTNSPILFGKELWAENRIALFKQSLDTRGNNNHYREKMPRVYFGKDWLTTTPIDVWKREMVRFPSVLMREEMEDAVEILENGGIPKLSSIRLHNGTTWTWNRMCYGVTNEKPHLRIECRYLPSGPTVVDEVANFVFWVGLMKGMPEEMKDFWTRTDFRSVKSNFIRAARTGINTVFEWNGERISAPNLIIDHLLGYAEKGLNKYGILEKDIEFYLGIIRQRAMKKTNGSEWSIRNFRKLLKHHKPSVASNFIALEMLDYQSQNLPVHKWGDVTSGYPKAEILAEDLMQSDIFSVQNDLPISYAEFVMNWRHFHHLPVEDEQGKLVGIISASQIDESIDKSIAISEIMVSDLITCNPTAPLEEVEQLLNDNAINSLLVVEHGRLIGILTNKDIPVESVIS